ncbi:hypothetical protein MHYP_G00150830 [Metynnis hypsauchen]
MSEIKAKIVGFHSVTCSSFWPACWSSEDQPPPPVLGVAALRGKCPDGRQGGRARAGAGSGYIPKRVWREVEWSVE